MPHFIETTLRLSVQIMDLKPRTISAAMVRLDGAKELLGTAGVYLTVEKPERVVTRRQKAAPPEPDDTQQKGGDPEAPGGAPRDPAAGDADSVLDIPAELRRTRA